MGASDGTILGTTKLVDHGPDTDKWCLLVTGDGFTAAEMSAFQAQVDGFVTFLEANLTGSANWDKVNVIRLDVESNDSGVDNPNCDASLKVDTYFDAEFCVGGLDRTIGVDEGLVLATADAEFPEWDAVLVFVNTTDYGGLNDGGVAAASLDPVWSYEIALHEMGHAAFGLADEYPSWAGCSSGETTQDCYPVATAGEPSEPNVTATLSPLKWAAHVTAVNVPTTSNADCTQCDAQADPEPGAVGAYEGARYHHCCAWRPAFTCRMNTLGVGFCAVCQAEVNNRLTWGSYLDVTPCFVATAVYGDRDHPDVATLRAWRDRHLHGRGLRRTAMRGVSAIYDQIGPGLANVVGARMRLRRLFREAVFAPWARHVRIAEGRSPRPLVGASRVVGTQAMRRCGCGGARTQDGPGTREP